MSFRCQRRPAVNGRHTTLNSTSGNSSVLSGLFGGRSCAVFQYCGAAYQRGLTSHDAIQAAAASRVAKPPLLLSPLKRYAHDGVISAGGSSAMPIRMHIVPLPNSSAAAPVAGCSSTEVTTPLRRRRP
jgi:hypothetical protein